MTATRDAYTLFVGADLAEIKAIAALIG